MSAEKSLDELKMLAKPALHHAELVDLVRTRMSPNEIIAIAAARWPPRPTKAVRFLAILRRDHGDNVFETFVASPKSTLAPISGEEHARGDEMTTTEIDREGLLRSLQHVGADKRLELLIEHKFKTEALAGIRELMATQTFHFQDSSRAGKYLIGEPITPQTPRHKVGDREVLYMVDAVAIQTANKESFTLRGLKAYFGWSDAELADFLREVFESTLKLNPRDDHWCHDNRLMCSWEFNATLNAVRHFLPKGDELRRRVELWVNRANFMDEYGPVRQSMPLMTVRHLIGGKRPRKNVLLRSENRHADKVKACNILADYMRGLGLSDEDLNEDFVVAIERSAGRLNSELTAGVLGSSVVQELDVERKARVKKLISATLLARIDSDLFGNRLGRAERLAWLETIGYGGIRSAEFQLAFRHALIERMADGRLVAAFELVEIYGTRFDCFQKRMRQHSDGTKVPDLSELAAEAFGRAFGKGSFGAAAQLVLVFGDDTCLKTSLFVDRAKAAAGEGELYTAQLEALCDERREQIRGIFDLARAVASGGLDMRLRHARPI